VGSGWFSAGLRAGRQLPAAMRTSPGLRHHLGAAAVLRRLDPAGDHLKKASDRGSRIGVGLLYRHGYSAVALREGWQKGRLPGATGRVADHPRAKRGSHRPRSTLEIPGGPPVGPGFWVDRSDGAVLLTTPDVGSEPGALRRSPTGCKRPVEQGCAEACSSAVGGVRALRAWSGSPVSAGPGGVTNQRGSSGFLGWQRIRERDADGGYTDRVRGGVEVSVRPPCHHAYAVPWRIERFPRT